MSLTPQEGDIIDVWFSCGAASAVALQETLRRYGNLCQIRVLNNPIAEEDEDNRRFLHDVERWLGVSVISVTNPDYPSNSAQEVWERRKYMSGVAGAPCTTKLKREARQGWEKANPADWLVLGFTADEQQRSDNFVKTERGNVLPVLIEAGITKDRCYEILVNAGLELPRMYRWGYPNANCPGCVKSKSVTYWNHVRVMHPAVFASRAEQSRRLGVRLVEYRGKRIFLDELPPEAQGRSLKSMKMPECGLFCESISETQGLVAA